MNEVILFRDGLFRGPHTHVFQAEPDLTQNATAPVITWNDQTSSIVVVEGTWMFYSDVNYGGEYWMLSPGTYPTLPANQNDVLSSLKPI
jgi:hypothetical protein